MSIVRSALSRRAATRLLLSLALLIGLGPGAIAPLATPAALAQEGQRDPRNIIATDSEGGKEAFVVKDEDGSDEYGRWSHRRWERDRDSTDVRVGPIITDVTVWVARDIEAAKKLFAAQAALNKDFPERDKTWDRLGGQFAFEVKEGPLPKEFTEESAALSACDDCDSKGAINTHRRVVVRKFDVVIVTYIFGRDNVATPEVATWHTRMMVERI